MNLRQTSHPLAHLGRGYLDSDSEFVYDPAGRLASAVFSPAYHVAFHPDIIVNIPEAPSTEISYSRDPAGRLLSSQLSNGVSTAFDYDPAGRLAGIAASNPLLPKEPYVNRSISRNAAGMIVALEDALPPLSDPAAPPLMSELTEFSYDDMGRLTAATHPERFATALPRESYTYSDDGLGSRAGASTGRIIDPDTRAPAADTLVFDPDTDQLLEDGLFSYAYDDNGNRVGKTRKSDGVTITYKYDAFDRLIYAGIDSDDPYPPASALGSRVYYAYDWAGRLARRISGCKADLDSLGGMYQAAEECVVARYAYDGLNLAAEYAEDGSPLVIYNHAPGSIDRPVSMQIEGAVFYFHYDERGSVTHITNGFGHIVQRYFYDSFGRIVLQQGALPNAFTYTGRHWDPVARLYHYRARAYDPDTGSFLQHDPIPAANPYAYTDNDPVNFTDPLGLKKREVKCWTYTRVSKSQYCVHDVCYPCGVKCQKHMRRVCESAGRSFRSTQAPSGVCTNCQPLDRVESCEKLCSKDVYPATCLKQCKDHLPPPAQDNPNGDGKNDGEPGKDVTTAPDDNVKNQNNEKADQCDSTWIGRSYGGEVCVGKGFGRYETIITNTKTGQTCKLEVICRFEGVAASFNYGGYITRNGPRNPKHLEGDSIMAAGAIGPVGISLSHPESVCKNQYDVSDSASGGLTPAEAFRGQCKTIISRCE